MMQKMGVLEAILIASWGVLDRVVQAIVQKCWIGFLDAKTKGMDW